MPIQVLDDPPPPPTLAEKLAPWLRRTLIGGCLIWICLSMQNFLEDTRTHTIKIVYPLLLNYERVTAPQPGFDPQKAEWSPVKTGFAVSDGTILFVKAGDSTYAVKLVRQTIQPEQAQYEFLKVGGTDPIVRGLAQTESGTINLPGHPLAWSGRRDGEGFLYLDDSFIWNDPPHYTIGVPFQSGDLQQFRHAVPASVHFESVPWKIANSGDTEIISAP
jgi:hypothetical protein